MSYYSPFEKIGVQNFRLFKDRVEFEPAPITVLTGPNNCGKSTFNKLQYLLMNGFELSPPEHEWDDIHLKNIDHLLLSEDILKNLSRFEENLNYKSEQNSMIFDFTFNYMPCDSNLPSDFTYQIFPDFKFKLEYSLKVRRGYKMNKLTLPGANQYVPLKKIEVWFGNEVIFDFERIYSKEIYTTKNISHQMVWEFFHKLEYKGKISAAQTLKNLIIGSKLSERMYFTPLLEEVDLEKLWSRYEKPLRSDDPNYTENTYLGGDYIFLSAQNPDDNHLLFSNFFIKVTQTKGFFKNHRFDEPDLQTLKEFLITKGITSVKQFRNCYGDFETSLILGMLTKNFGELSKLYPNWQYPEYLEVFGKNLNDIIRIKYWDINLEKDEMKDLISGIENPLTDLFLNEIDWNNYVLRTSRRAEDIKIRNFIETKDNVELFQAMKQPENKYLSCGDLNAFYKMFLQLSSRIFLEFQSNLLSYISSTHVDILKQDAQIKNSILIEDKSEFESPFYSFGLNFLNNEDLEDNYLFINNWIKEIGAGDELLLKAIENGIDKKPLGVTYFIKRGNETISLDSLGLGMQKMIHLLIKIVEVHKKIAKFGPCSYKSQHFFYHPEDRKILLLEEPESNLHPNLQSKLAEIITDAMLYLGINFVIETHSEYLIRKFQYLVASNQNELRNDLISIHYLYDPANMPEGEKQVYKLDIREDGFMNNDFGKGFFDEASSLSLSLLNLKNFN